MAARWLETLAYDMRHACRVLWRAKTFSSAAVLTLALGIAGTVVMFALVDGVLLQPLPVRQQDRLIVAWREASTSGSARYPFGDREIDLVADASRLLESAAGVTRNGVARSVVTDGGRSSYANVALVTGGFFDVLGVQPLAGRALSRADDGIGVEPAIVISYGFWQRHYGADAAVVGKRLGIGEQQFTIAGVMPPGLDFPAGVEIWRTTRSVPADGPFGDAAQREVNLLARLREGVTIEQAASELESLNQQLAAEASTRRDALLRGFAPVVRSFEDVVIGDVRGTMLALFGAVGLVLLIASANVANLLLMRGESRRTEIALRGALGAERGRIVRQIVADSFVLSVAAGILGCAAAAAALPLLLAMVPDGLPRMDAVRMDWAVMCFAAGVVFITALIAGLTPGLLAVRGDLITPLRGGSAAVAGGSRARGRRGLIVAQVALAVMVLAAAGLLIRSVVNLHAIDLGLAADRLSLVELHLPPAHFRESYQRAQFLDAAISGLEAVPGVSAATPVNVSPFADRGWDVPRVTVEGQSADEAAGNPSLNLESIHPNYFSTFEVPLIHGRAFSTADRQGTTPVAIVSEDAAARLWPQQDPIGKRLKLGPVDSSGRWLEVVGVAAMTRYRTVTRARPTLYLPAPQFQMTASLLVVRSTAPLDVVAAAATDRLRQVDPNVRVMRVASFDDHLERPLARPRFAAFLLGLFAAAALLLASIGLYAVMATSVRQRDREIAVRLALGAQQGTVTRMILSEAASLAAAGAVIGVGGAIALAQALQGMLFEVSALDPFTIGAAALVLIAAAGIASAVPIRRVTRRDLVASLRSE